MRPLRPGRSIARSGTGRPVSYAIGRFAGRAFGTPRGLLVPYGVQGPPSWHWQRGYAQQRTGRGNQCALAGLTFDNKAACLSLAAADLFAYSVKAGRYW